MIQTGQFNRNLNLNLGHLDQLRRDILRWNDVALVHNSLQVLEMFPIGIKVDFYQHFGTVNGVGPNSAPPVGSGILDRISGSKNLKLHLYVGNQENGSEMREFSLDPREFGVTHQNQLIVKPESGEVLIAFKNLQDPARTARGTQIIERMAKYFPDEVKAGWFVKIGLKVNLEEARFRTNVNNALHSLRVPEIPEMQLLKKAS